jgi:hypothetical protein
MTDATPTPQPVIAPARRSWTLPVLKELPKLTDLTLASAIGGGGGTGGGGSTVFGLLTSLSLGASLAAGLLAGCSAGESTGPSLPPMPEAVAAVDCVASVAARQITCGGPRTAPGQEILGGQGTRVVLRSSNVAYTPADSNFTFDVSVQNLGVQQIGSDGSSTTGIRVFFQDLPTAVLGAGAIDIEHDSVGTFTAPNQSYYVYNEQLLSTETSSLQTWEFNVDPGVQTFSFTVLVAADVPDAGGILRWRPVTGRTGMRLTGLAYTADNDILVVGPQGRALRWNGTVWRPLTVATGWDFNAAAAVGGGEYIVVGQGGVIFRLKNDIWTYEHQSPSGFDLSAVWALDADDFVAVGKNGLIVRSTGGVFTEELLASGDNVFSVAGTSDGSAVTALTEGNRLNTSTGGAAFVEVAWVDGFAGGVAYDPADALLWSYLDLSTLDGMVWRDGDLIFQQVVEWPKALIPLSGDRVAIAQHSFNDNYDYLTVVDYSGSLPGAHSYISDALGHEIRSFVMASADESQFLVTELNPDNDLFRWNGAGWVGEQSTTGGTDADLWGIGNTAWHVDGSGAVGRIVNGVVTELLPLPSSRRIWARTASELYVADDTALWVGDGTGAWTHELTMKVGNTLREVWGDPASGTIIALGDNGEFRTRIAGVWNDEETKIPRNVNDVWGCSATEAWIVTNEGDVWHWDGATASEDLVYSATIAPASIRGVGGTSCTDVWVASDGGGAHWDGTLWTQVAFGTMLTTVTPRDAGRAYLLSGQGMNDYLGDSTGAATQIPVPTQEQQVQAAWTLDNGELLVAGARYIIRGMR